MKTFGMRNILLFVLIALLLLGGIGITGVAAQSSLPGDALYTVKTSIEQTRLTLAKDASDRAQLALGFAEERLNEISQLINEGRTSEIKNAVLAFEASINRAIIELETVSKGDPTLAAQLAQEITSALTRYAQTLSLLAASAPESIMVDVLRALDSTNLAGSIDVTSSNDNANDNENSNDDNANDNNANDNNTNLNDNTNSSSNTNTNSNVNSNINSNTNDNTNSNSNTNVNTNSNSNDNSNSNSNDNSNSNTNDNSNDDKSGKGGGSNGNDNTNSNSNGGG